ncbi:hypothetical protein [Novipirellula caenicola]|uniref:Uncharacterized protein n=1 Tax=Novipirellula caenicola TaxID=1536901 RepID=A0ABP9W3R1_9BACT
MSFDVDKLFVYSRTKIAEFALEHQQEVFYAFAIDASNLCLNSLQAFEVTLKAYQSRWEKRTRIVESLFDLSDDEIQAYEYYLQRAERTDGLDRSDEVAVLNVINANRADERGVGCEYYTERGITYLRNNTGDWAYQGFSQLDDKFGFDIDLYNDHYYDAMDSDSSNSEYARSMTLLVDRLKNTNAFDALRRTKDFNATWVDHTY